MAKVTIFETEIITKYNHNHDPATGRFTTGSGGSGTSGSGSGGSGGGATSGRGSGTGASGEGVDYDGLEREFRERLEQVKNHPSKDKNPEAHAKEVKRWENRIKQLQQLKNKADYDELRGEFKERLERAINHPDKDRNPRVWEQEVRQWENRIKLLDEKYKPYVAGHNDFRAMDQGKVTLINTRTGDKHTVTEHDAGLGHYRWKR